MAKKKYKSIIIRYAIWGTIFYVLGVLSAINSNEQSEIMYKKYSKKLMDISDKEEELKNKERNLDMSIKKAKRTAYGYKLKIKNKLHKLYSNLYLFEKNKENIPGEKYLKSFSISESSNKSYKLKIVLENQNSSSISPRFEIIFLNQEGFKTANVKVHWLMDTIGKGETRVVDKHLTFDFGRTIYYILKFEK